MILVATGSKMMSSTSTQTQSIRGKFLCLFCLLTILQSAINFQSYRTLFTSLSDDIEDSLPYIQLSLNETSQITTFRRPRQYGDSNLAKPRRNHPHAGAIDEFGHFGYVHDPTILKDTPSQFQVTIKEKEQLCATIGTGPEGNNSLSQTIFGKHIHVLPETLSKDNNINVFCAVYTYPGNINQTIAIRDTWGRRCDGFMAASTETVHEDAIVHIPHKGRKQGKYKGIWQKVRSILGYFYDNFINDYDFIFLSGDDTFLIVENLKSLLQSQKFIEHAGGKDYPNPVHIGAWSHKVWEQHMSDYDPNLVYMGGGAGYVLNRAAVRALVEKVLPVCKQRKDGSAEDVYMSECLQYHLNVTGYDARDEHERDRFIQYDPVRRADVLNPIKIESKKYDRLQKYVIKQNLWLKQHYNWTAKYGIDAISPSAITFHKIQPAVKMKRYERIFYRMKDEETNRKDCYEIHALKTM